MGHPACLDFELDVLRLVTWAKQHTVVRLVPILVLLVLGEVSYLNPAVGWVRPIVDIVLGLYIVGVRRLLSRTLLDWQRRVWGHPSGESELDLSTLIVGATGMGFVAAGIWDLTLH